MHQVDSPVKSRGTLLDTIKVSIYDTHAELLKVVGEQALLSTYNQSLIEAATNKARTALTREVSPEAKLRKLYKSSDWAKQEIDSMLAKAEAAAKAATEAVKPAAVKK